MSPPNNFTPSVDPPTSVGSLPEQIKKEGDVLDNFDFDSFLEPATTAATLQPSVPTTRATGSHLSQGTANQAGGTKRSFDESQYGQGDTGMGRTSNNSLQPTRPLPLIKGGKFTGFARSYLSKYGLAIGVLNDDETAIEFEKLGDHHSKLSEHYQKISDDNQSRSDEYGRKSNQFLQEARRLRAKGAGGAASHKHGQGGPPPTGYGSIGGSDAGLASNQTRGQPTQGEGEAAETANPCKRTRTGKPGR